MQHVSWYFFYTFVNLIFSIINLIVAFPSIYGIIISIVHLLIAVSCCLENLLNLT